MSMALEKYWPPVLEAYRQQDYLRMYRSWQTFLSLNPPEEEGLRCLNDLVFSLIEDKKVTEALQLLEFKMPSDHFNSERFYLLGGAYFLDGNWEKAKLYFEKASQLCPEKFFWHLKAQTLAPTILRTQQEQNSYRQNLMHFLDNLAQKSALISLEDLPVLACEPPFFLCYQGENDVGIKKKYGDFFSRLLEVQYPKLTQKPSIQKKTCYRLAFLVTKGHEGVFCKLAIGLINHLSRDRFDVFIVCDSSESASALAFQLQNVETEFVISPQPLMEKILFLKQKEFDVVFYFEVGTDTVNYFLPFFHLAPIQLTSIGFPVTTGIPGMNYFLSSTLLETPEGPSHYTEKLLLLEKSMPTYFYRPSLPSKIKSREALGLSPSGHVYLCPQSLFKLHPDFDPILLEILSLDPEGHLYFLEGKSFWMETLTERWKILTQKNQSPDALLQRIHFLPRMNSEDFLILLSLCDVMLDPLHVTGGITTHEAFAFGTPIVTLPSPYFRGRMTQACYKAMGILDCIATSPEEYVRLTVELGTNPEFNQSIRTKILRHNVVLYENLSTVRTFEKLLLNAIEETFEEASQTKIQTMTMEGISR